MLKRIIQTSIFLAFCLGSYAQGALSITFSGINDTVMHHCGGEALDLIPVITGGVAPYQVQWSTDGNGSNWFTAPTLSFTPTDPLTIVKAVVSDDLNDTDTVTLVIHVHPECVWPGDANGDGIANNIDILNIGRAYGISGFERPNAHLNWMAQPAPAWLLDFHSGVNYAHADADGNGYIDNGDIQGILQNYNVPQNQGNTISGGQGAALFVDIPNGTVQPGDTVVASIILGTQSIPADSIYGLAFSVKYAGYSIDSGSVEISYDNSWLGTPGQDLATLEKLFYGDNQVDIGIVRINNAPKTGFGRVADITVMVDEIIGKKAGIETIDFYIDHVSLISPSGNFLPVNTPMTQLAVITSNDAVILNDSWNVSVDSDVLYINAKDDLRDTYDLKIRDTQGRIVSEMNELRDRSISLPLGNISKGCYILTIENEGEIFNQKFMK